MDSSEIKTLSDLKHYLYLAMQLEHATLPPYLTALYSIQPGTNSDAVHIIRVIAVEEMLHLTIAANLLNAIGGTPDLTRSGFVPSYPTYLPDGETDFLVHLAPFGKDTVEMFKQIERPSLAPAGTPKLVNRPARAGGATLASPKEGMDYYSIGDFYEAVKQGFIDLEAEARRRGETIFTGDPGRQVTAEYYYSGGGKLFPVTGLATALAAIELVIQQGEGATDHLYAFDKELAHYYRFDQLSLGRYYQPGDAIGHPTGAALSVDWDAVYPVKMDIKLADYRAGTELHAAAAAFNAAYARFLGDITVAYNGKPEKLVDAVATMFDFRNAMNQLIRNPLTGDAGENAGPTFEIQHASSAAPQVTAGELETTV